MELVARRRHVAPSKPVAHGRDRQPPRRDGRLRLVATPGRSDPVRPPMEPTAQSPGDEKTHQGGTGNFHAARMEAVRRRNGTGLPSLATPPNRPKLAGASAKPHGAFNWPCCATRTSSCPSVSKASTKPRPWPSISSFAPGPCFEYVTKIRGPIVWIPNGA